MENEAKILLFTFLGLTGLVMFVTLIYVAYRVIKFSIQNTKDKLIKEVKNR